MTAYTGTIETPPKNGENGQQYWVYGTYALTAGGLDNTDTLTWTGLLPSTGDYWIKDVKLVAPELDTNASPTFTFTVGDGTDADAYIITTGGGVALSNSLAEPLVRWGNGASVGTKITTPVPNVVLTGTAANATKATSGTIRIGFLIEGAM